ncbi:MAG: hypothetical protein ACKOQ8_05930 [Micrococcales bacterium]
MPLIVKTSTDQSNDTHFTLGLMLMAIGLNEISEANLKEVQERVFIWQALNGPISNPAMTDEMLAKFVGTTANTGNETRAKFVKRAVETGVRFRNQ